MNAQPRDFEFFLAALMTHSEPAADPSKFYPREYLTTFDFEAEGAAFWSAPSLKYFDHRLQLVGCDTDFDVALELQSGTRRHRFALNLWPSFELGLLTARESGMVFYPHFVRRTTFSKPVPARPDALLPWSATIEEVLRSFGRPLDVSGWDLRRWMTYNLGEQRWIFTFDLGLIQSVLPERGSVLESRSGDHQI